MCKEISQIMVILILGVITVVALFNPSIAAGQQDKSDANDDQYPTYFKVYSADGSESLTATCTPIEIKPTIDHVTCRFINVSFQPSKTDYSFLFLMQGDLSAEDGSIAGPLSDEQKKYVEESQKILDDGKRELCSDKEFVTSIETRIRNPQIGPKRKSHLQQLIAACADSDSTVFYRRMEDLGRRTCYLWVDRFTLQFKNTGPDRWLVQGEVSDRRSKDLKKYELYRVGLGWAITETRIPTEGANTKPTQTVWSWKNFGEYELPCDFISHQLIWPL